MGFPVGYSYLFLPKLILHILTLLSFLQTLISTIFSFIGLQHLLQPPPSTHFQSFSTILLRELLPIVKFSDLVNPPESCVVCLYEFASGDEIRVLNNCTHVFHRCCLDRWMDHDRRKTCPLCRTPFISDDLQDSFNERLWAASGIADYHDYS